MKSLKVILLLSFCYALMVNSYANLANPVLMANIEHHFWVDGHWDFEKIQAYKHKVEKRRDELRFLLGTTKISPERLKHFNILISKIDQLILNPKEKLKTAEIILELDFALQYQSNQNPLAKGINKVSNIFSNYKIPRYASAQMESINLYDIGESRVLNLLDIQNHKKENNDFSHLSPSDENGFLESHENLDSLESMIINEGNFDSVQMGISGIELYVTKKVSGVERKFKIVLGEQVQAQLMSEKLLKLLSYKTKQSFFEKSFKLNLPKGMDILTFKKFWKNQGKLENIDPHIESSGTKSSGQKYLSLKDVQVIVLPTEKNEVGPWSWARLGKDLNREVRGLLFFNIWIGNELLTDNSTSISLKDLDSFQINYYQNHFGNAFRTNSSQGSLSFDWDLVLKSNEKSITFNYKNLSNLPSLKRISFSDAKWMTRKICELTRDDISMASKDSGWNEDDQIIVTEKLIYRRNQLVEAFDLENECTYMKVNLPQNMDPQNKLALYSEPEKSMVSEVEEQLQPYVDNIEVLALDIALKTTDKFNTIVIDGQTLGIDSYILAGVEISTDRIVTPNSNSKGNDDQYLVMDRLKISYSLGAGIVFRGKMNYIKEYKLVYPVSKFNDLEDKNLFLINAIRHKSRRTTELPKSYVLIMEDSFEGEAEVLIGQNTAFLSYGESYAIGKLNRYIISQSKENILVQHDISPYRTHASALYAELLFFRFPLWSSPNSHGVLNSKKYLLKLNNKASYLALDYFYETGDLSKVLGLSEKIDVNGTYDINKGYFSLLGFVESSYEVRVDDFEEVIYSEDDQLQVNSYIQVDSEEKFEWGIFDYGEVKQEKFKLLGKVNESGSVEDIYLEIAFSLIDKTTTLKELDKGYLNFIDKLAMKENFLYFTPTLHTQENYWGEVMIYSRLGYDQNALDKIINTASDDFYHLMAKFDPHKYHNFEFWKRRSPKNLKPGIRKYKQRLREFISVIEKCKKMKKGHKDRYKLFAQAFENMVWPNRDSFNISFLRRLNYLIGKDNYFMDADLRSKSNHYILFSQGGGLYTYKNPQLQKNIDLFEFRFKDPNSIWSAYQLKAGSLPL